MAGHNGVDFAVPVGTPVYATHDGVIQFSQVDSSDSLTISVDSLDGTIRTLNCHMSTTKVVVGQQVRRGDLIGLSGNTGRYTTGPHLHHEIIELTSGHVTNPGNGFNGAVNNFNYYDGTYPISNPKDDTTDFVLALNKYQISKGIKPYPKIGPQTLLALKKDNLI
jgi:murein DD-endopeptidase MepM/ murein hydrolase activator NlpD